MLTPEQIEALRETAEQLAAPVVNFLLRDIVRRIMSAGQLTGTAAYQIWRAQQLGAARQAIKAFFKEQTGKTEKEIDRLFTQTAETGYSFDLKNLPTEDAIPFEDNAELQELVRASARLAGDGFTNITGTLGMVDPFGRPQPLQTAYRKCMDYAFNLVSTGAADYNTAIRQATRNLANEGVRYIDYESGVHTSLEAAVRRNIMGGLGLMFEEISGKVHEDLKCNGWEVSAHAASAPDHEPIQGRQFTDQEFLRLNGTAETPGELKRRIGTLHCGHIAFPIILGVNKPQYTEAQLAAFKTANAEGITYNGRHYTKYKATQKQRQIERSIRTQKRRILVDEETKDSEKLLTDRIRLVRLNDEYKRFSKAAGLREQVERAQLEGFGSRDMSKATREAERYYVDWSKSAGINNSIKTLANYYDVKYNDSPRYELLKQYAKDVENGWISPLVTFDGYERAYNRIQNEIVGQKTSDGILITGQSRHFMQRVVGTMADPEKLKNLQVIRRSGVEVDDIKEALYRPVKICSVKVAPSGNKSVKLRGKRCAITINPETGILIQTNPSKEE